MSVGLFLGIRAAYSPDDAERYLAAVKAALSSAELPTYDEPWDAESGEAKYNELRGGARTKLDVLSSALQPLARMIVRARGAAAGPFRDFSLATERIFIPGDFLERIDAPGVPSRSLWSTGALIASLKSAALAIGLPLVSGEVPPLMLPKIDKGRKLSKNDPVSQDEDENGYTMLGHFRPTWLALAEFARVAHTHKLALALSAG